MQEFLFAQLTACTVNFGFRGPKEAVQPKDFMPSLMISSSTEQVKKHRKRDLIAAQCRDVMSHFMG